MPVAPRPKGKASHIADRILGNKTTGKKHKTTIVKLSKNKKRLVWENTVPSY